MNSLRSYIWWAIWWTCFYPRLLLQNKKYIHFFVKLELLKLEIIKPWESTVLHSGFDKYCRHQVHPKRRKTCSLTHSMKQSPSWGANRFSAGQEMPRILWNPKVHYRIPSARHPSLSWARSIHSMLSHHTSWRSILILYAHLRLGLPSGLFPSGLPTNTLYTPLLSPIRAACPAHLILLDLITRKILGEECKSLSSSLCSFLHSPVSSSVTTYKNTRCQNSECKNLNQCLNFWFSQHTLIKIQK